MAGALMRVISCATRAGAHARRRLAAASLAACGKGLSLAPIRAVVGRGLALRSPRPEGSSRTATRSPSWFPGPAPFLTGNSRFVAAGFASQRQAGTPSQSEPLFPVESGVDSRGSEPGSDADGEPGFVM